MEAERSGWIRGIFSGRLCWSTAMRCKRSPGWGPWWGDEKLLILSILSRTSQRDFLTVFFWREGRQPVCEQQEAGSFEWTCQAVHPAWQLQESTQQGQEPLVWDNGSSGRSLWTSRLHQTKRLQSSCHPPFWSGDYLPFTEHQTCQGWCWPSRWPFGEGIVISILQEMALRLREVQQLVQDYTAGRQGRGTEPNWNSTQALLLQWLSKEKQKQKLCPK